MFLIVIGCFEICVAAIPQSWRIDIYNYQHRSLGIVGWLRIGCVDRQRSRCECQRSRVLAMYESLSCLGQYTPHAGFHIWHFIVASAHSFSVFCKREQEMRWNPSSWAFSPVYFQSAISWIKTIELLSDKYILAKNQFYSSSLSHTFVYCLLQNV